LDVGVCYRWMVLQERRLATVMSTMQYATLQVVSIDLVSGMVMSLHVSVQTHTITSLCCLLQCVMELQLPLLTRLTLHVSWHQCFFFFAELTNLNVFVWCGPDRSMSGWHSGCCCYKVLKFFLECWVERCKEFNAGIFTVETMWFSTVILTLKIPESFFSEEFYPSNWHVAVDIVYCLV